jgi:2-phosphosulfolactate phosphatase
VVDVLRATTVMVRALAAGAEAVVPCGEIDEARSVAAAMPAGSAVLGGERQGLPIEGFDLGNSPASYTEEACRGKTVVMTTTNGTRAILAALAADRVLVAAFSNLASTTAALADLDVPIHVVCSGTDGRISLEDSLLAGALARDLGRTRDEAHLGRPYGNDEAEMAAWLWASIAPNEIYDDWDQWLADYLSLGRGGRRVREIGLTADLADAARVSQFPVVAELTRNPLKIIRTDA